MEAGRATGWHLGLAVAACAAGAAGVSAGPAALNDGQLDAITSGGTWSHSAVVADNAHFEYAQAHRLQLDGEVQRQARALNMVNAAGADVGNAVNLLAGADAQASQQNQVVQQESGTGSLQQASLEAGGESWRAGSEINSSSSSDHSLASTDYQHLQSSNVSISHSNASVPGYEATQDLSVEVGTLHLDPLQFGPLVVDLLTGESGSETGLRGTAGPYTIEAPRLVIGTAHLDGDDIVLDPGYLDIGEFNLGSLQLDAYFSGRRYAGFDVDLGEISGQIDLPADALRLEGANPFKDVHVNVGAGIAAAGRGRIAAETGHLTVAAQVEVDLPDLTLDVSTILANEPDGLGGIIGEQNLSFTIDLPSVELSHTLIDENVGFTYSAEFDGALCLVAGPSGNCGTLERHVESTRTLATEVIRDQSSNHSATEDRIASLEHRTQSGASMVAAEAELIAMSRSSALISSDGGVSLGNSAQLGLNALNAVNAAGAMVGNTLNAAVTVPAASAAPATRGPTVLAQANTFIQLQTGYSQRPAGIP